MAEPTTAPTRPLKAVAYVRVSTDRQSEEGFGLIIQRETVRRRAHLAGHRLVAVHADEGVSGTRPVAARPGLTAALDMIRSGEADALLLPKLDRLARTLSVQEAALASVWAQGGRVFLPEGEVLRDDPDDPMRTAMRQMMGVFSQLERGMITARLRAGRAAKAAAGGYAYGSPPFGWRADKTSPTGLAPVAVEQRGIERMVAWRADGVPMREMARRLNGEGIPPKRRTADRHSPRGNQAPIWSVSSIRRVLARHDCRQLRRSRRWPKPTT
jgi:DNA invertase Pin-like site-specific DNA recombinase